MVSSARVTARDFNRRLVRRFLSACFGKLVGLGPLGALPPHVIVWGDPAPRARNPRQGIGHPCLIPPSGASSRGPCSMVRVSPCTVHVQSRRHADGETPPSVSSSPASSLHRWSNGSLGSNSNGSQNSNGQLARSLKMPGGKTTLFRSITTPSHGASTPSSQGMSQPRPASMQQKRQWHHQATGLRPSTAMTQSMESAFRKYKSNGRHGVARPSTAAASRRTARSPDRAGQPSDSRGSLSPPNRPIDHSHHPSNMDPLLPTSGEAKGHGFGAAGRQHRVQIGQGVTHQSLSLPSSPRTAGPAGDSGGCGGDPVPADDPRAWTLQPRPAAEAAPPELQRAAHVAGLTATTAATHAWGGKSPPPTRSPPAGWRGSQQRKVKPSPLVSPSAVTVEHYSVLSVIGRGSFGKVVLARDQRDGKTFAVKALRKERCLEPRHERRARTERNVLTLVDHPFIARLFHTFQDTATLFFVLEFCPGGELFFHLGRLKRFSETMARFYAAEITLALAHIHQLHIAYRDLKPENILLDASGHVQLVDFGLAKEKVFRPDQGASSMCGTYEYLAPEVIRRVGHGYAVDWWNLGMVLFEMLTGLPPWYTKDRKKLFDRICNKNVEFPSSVSQDAAGLISRLLNKNPGLRLGSQRGASELQQQAFFSSVNWAALLKKQTRAPLTPCKHQDRSASEVATSVANFDRRFTSLPVDSEVFVNAKEDKVKCSDGSAATPGTNGTSRGGGRRVKTDGDAPNRLGTEWQDWDYVRKRQTAASG